MLASALSISERSVFDTMSKDGMGPSPPARAMPGAVWPSARHAVRHACHGTPLGGAGLLDLHPLGVALLQELDPLQLFEGFGQGVPRARQLRLEIGCRREQIVPPLDGGLGGGRVGVVIGVGDARAFL